MHSDFPSVILPVKRNLQDNEYDCGPASLKIVLNTLGGRTANEKLLMNLASTTKDGTRPRGLIKVLKILKIKHVVIPHTSITMLAEKIATGNLCLIDYQAWSTGGSKTASEKAGHYSVVFGFNSSHFFLADPGKRHTPKDAAFGFRSIKKSLLDKRWHDHDTTGRKTRHFMIAIPIF